MRNHCLSHLLQSSLFLHLTKLAGIIFEQSLWGYIFFKLSVCNVAYHFCSFTLFTVSFVLIFLLFNLVHYRIDSSISEVIEAFFCLLKWMKRMLTLWSKSARSTARCSTWRLNSWISVRGIRTFSGTGIGSLWSKPLWAFWRRLIKLREIN